MGIVLMPSVGSSADFDAVTAVASDILSGKIAIGADGEPLTGTMTNRGTWTSTPSSSGKVTIPKGYHNGNGYVNTSTVYSEGYNAGYSEGYSDGESDGGAKYKTGTFIITEQTTTIDLGFRPDVFFFKYSDSDNGTWAPVGMYCGINGINRAEGTSSAHFPNSMTPTDNGIKLYCSNIAYMKDRTLMYFAAKVL